MYFVRKTELAARAFIRRALRSRMETLRSQAGSASEAIVGTALALLIIGIIGTGTVSAMSALTVGSSNAERTQQLNVMAGKPSLTEGWAAATVTPLKSSITLPSGTVLDAYLWALPKIDGIAYYVSTARSGNMTDTAACANMTVVKSDLCLYASQFHAIDPRSTLPKPVTGLVVADLSTPILIDRTIASGPAPAAPTDYRFYIKAAAVGAQGEIDFTQNGKVVNVVPISATADDYFGTFTVQPGPAFTISSPDRTVNVMTVLIYKAGA